MNKVLEIKNLTKSFYQGGNKLTILEDVNFSFEQGQFYTLIGESGCGKTSFLQLVGLLDQADKGDVLIDNVATRKINDDKKTKIRLEKLGFIYQFHNLMPEFNVIENVAIPLFLNNHSSAKAYKKAETILNEIGLAERIKHKPTQLSGGEQQRVAIARAIIHEPKIILADEPTGNLDPDNADKIFTLFRNIVKQKDITVIMVTHNHKLSENSDKVVTIRNKKIEKIR